MNDAETIAHAITQAREAAGLTQAELGALVAHIERRHEPYGQGAASEWERGKSLLKPTRIFTIEKALKLKPGTLSRVLGYVPADSKPAMSVDEAINADPRLTPDQRQMLLAAYRAAVGRRR